jgi:hypothetical protein
MCGKTGGVADLLAALEDESSVRYMLEVVRCVKPMHCEFLAEVKVD